LRRLNHIRANHGLDDQLVKPLDRERLCDALNAASSHACDPLAA
jgi:hypothetical protein